MAKKKITRAALPGVPARASFAPRDLGIFLALILATGAVYSQVAGHQFISLDDDIYLRDNIHVARGLTFSGIAWAFTTFHATNWHPLTWLSHMLDAQIFGMRAGAHLLVNAGLHAANSCLVFWFLRRVTAAAWRSALVAAVFALHPLHVESVAWAAERKDTLAAFFGLLALIAYARYAEKKSPLRFALVAVLLALGLMAKPMLVTWPFVFLLLDFWPLGRLILPTNVDAKTAARAVFPLLREKVPLFAIVAASMLLTFLAQSAGGAVRALEDEPLGLRLANALVSSAKYFLATFWPIDLAVYYPFPAAGIPAWQIIGAGLLLLALSALFFFQARRRPWLLVGWLWFLGTLVPVIGLVQVGGQAMADRYHYLPSLGLFVALAFFLGEVAEKWRAIRVPVVVGSVAALAACAALSFTQVARWRDSITLFRHTLAVTSDNLLIEYNLGHVLGQQRRYPEALAHFAAALRINPDFFDALVNTGMTLAEMGRAADALPYFERALGVRPDSSKAHTQLALAFTQLDKKAEALREFRRALELAPESADAHSNLGLMLARLGDPAEGLEHLRAAVRLDPGNAEAHNNLGLVLLAQGDARSSIPHFEAALRLKPDLTVARQNLERARAQTR